MAASKMVSHSATQASAQKVVDRYLKQGYTLVEGPVKVGGTDRPWKAVMAAPKA